MATFGLTVGAGGLAAGAAAAAVAGAVGLGIAGLAAALASRGGNRSQRKGHHHRHGRSVTGETSPNLLNMMELIRQEDVTGCGLKLMCELASGNPEELVDEELAILGLVGPALVPGEDVRGLGALGEYRAAKAFGHNQGNCGEAFYMCPLNGTQLMDTVMGYLP